MGIKQSIGSKRNHDGLKIEQNESTKGKSLSSIHEQTDTESAEKSDVTALHDNNKEKEMGDLVGSILSSGTDTGRKKHVVSPQAISLLNNGWTAVGKARETDEEKEQAKDEVLGW